MGMVQEGKICQLSKYLKNILVRKLLRILFLIMSPLFQGNLSQLVQDLYQNNGFDWYSNQDMLDSYQRRRTQPD